MIPQKLLWFTAAAFTAWGATALPSATLNQNQVITGQLEGTVESFRGIPFANPPLGDLRFKHPTDYTGSYQGLKADNFRGACMQLDPAKVFTILDNVLNLASIIPSSIRGPLYDIADGSVSMSEDCLYLNVYRPKGTNSTAKLPVMVWIYGGAFLLGSTATYPGDNYIMESVNMGQPVIFVSIAYRTGPYGFLGGEAITNEGSTNSGLHDQRKALEWIQDNIANFGGDPSRVMIFGESAGSMSVAHQMAAYGGNNTYKGNQLFTSAIMQSGGPLPFYNTESYAPTSQYNRFVQYAGCQNAGSDADTLACLRSKSTAVLADAQNSYGLSDLYGLMPEFFGFSPRPDGDILPDSTFNLYKQGKVAQIPFITGNQEDEGTLFAAVAINATTTADVKKWLASFITQASSSTLDNVLSLYNANPINGSPFRTLFLNAITPQWKRIAALITDLLFHSPRRVMLENSSQTRYTYLSTTLHNLVPVLGTFHANDVIFQYYLNLGPYKAYRKYFISFANNHDPNVNTGLTKWNPYTTANKEMLQIPWLSPYMGTDSFRRESINYLMTTNELQAKK